MEALVHLKELPIKEIFLLLAGLVALFGFGFYINALRKRHTAYYLDTPPFSKDTLRKIALAKGDDLGPLKFPEEAEEAKKWFKELEQSDAGKLRDYNHAYSLQKEVAVYVQNKWWRSYERLLENGSKRLSKKVFKEPAPHSIHKDLKLYFTGGSYEFLSDTGVYLSSVFYIY